MRVAVLMSTYQGEAFVADQIDSILKQLPPDGRLMVRDDGSVDRTVEIVRSYADARISVVCGTNIGFVRSFFSLMTAAPGDVEMFMLSDQDDVWLPHKIDRAWLHIGTSGSTPTLYCARQQLVDSQLRPIGLSTTWRRRPSFENALAENIVTGCTAALNRAALQLVLRTGDASRIHFHDWWMYLVVAGFGTVVSDDVPVVLYRQHGDNVVGRGPGLRRYLVNLRFVLKRSWVHIMFSQIENLRLVHGAALSTENRLLLDRRFNPASAGAIASLVAIPHRYRQKALDDILWRLLLLGEVLIGRGLLPIDSRRSPARETNDG